MGGNEEGKKWIIIIRICYEQVTTASKRRRLDAACIDHVVVATVVCWTINHPCRCRCSACSERRLFSTAGACRRHNHRPGPGFCSLAELNCMLFAGDRAQRQPRSPDELVKLLRANILCQRSSRLSPCILLLLCCELSTLHRFFPFRSTRHVKSRCCRPSALLSTGPSPCSRKTRLEYWVASHVFFFLMRVACVFSHIRITTM
jgi:hypothetical protein